MTGGGVAEVFTATDHEMNDSDLVPVRRSLGLVAANSTTARNFGNYPQQ